MDHDGEESDACLLPHSDLLGGLSNGGDSTAGSAMERPWRENNDRRGRERGREQVRGRWASRGVLIHQGDTAAWRRARARRHGGTVLPLWRQGRRSFAENPLHCFPFFLIFFF